MHCIEMQPLNCPNWREIKFWPAVVLLVVALTNPVRGCLRATIDERAVQWASAIVEAKLAQAGDTVDLGLTPAQSYRIYIFEVLDVLDGPAKSRDKIDVLRLIGGVEEASACAVQLDAKSTDKSFVLLLRPLSQCGMNERTRAALR